MSSVTAVVQELARAHLRQRSQQAKPNQAKPKPRLDQAKPRLDLVKLKPSQAGLTRLGLGNFRPG